MDENLTVNPLGTEKIGKLITKFAVPSVISLVINSLYNMVDQVFIGNGVGYLGNAATNVVMPMTLIILAIGLMLGNGTSAFMSLNLGEGKEKKAAKGLGNMFVMGIVVSVLALVVFLVFLKPLCVLFGATDECMQLTLDYGRIIAIGFPFSLFDMMISHVLRADGRPKASMAGMIVGCGTNIVLDPLFIFVFKWGVKGAAFATIIGQFLNLVFYIFTIRKFDTVTLTKEEFKLEGRTMLKICTLGFSSFVTQIAATVVMTVQNKLLVKYGALSVYGAEIPLAALGITMKTGQLIGSICLGISTGIQPILGFNYGSRQYDRVKKTLKTALFICLGIMIGAFAIFEIFPKQIVEIFGQESELYMQFAVKSIRVYLSCCFMIPLSMVIGIFFQGIGKPVPSIIISFLRQIVVLVPALFIMGYTMGVEGLLAAGPISDAVSGVVSVIILAVMWKKIFPKNENNLIKEEIKK